MSLEPRARYGYWTNGSKRLAVYKLADGTHEVVEGAPLPRPQDNLAKPSAEPLAFARLRVPTDKDLKQRERLKKAYSGLNAVPLRGSRSQTGSKSA